MGTVGIQPKYGVQKRIIPVRSGNGFSIQDKSVGHNRRLNFDGKPGWRFLGKRQKTGSATPKQLLKSLAEVARNAVPLNLRIAKMEDPDQLIPTFQAVKSQKKGSKSQTVSRWVLNARSIIDVKIGDHG